MYCRRLFFNLFLMFFASNSYAEHDTLMDIYALAKVNDHELKADYAEYLANREVAEINRAALLPQLNGTVTASHSQVDSNTSESDTDAQNYNLSLTQSIYNSSNFSTYKQGQSQAQAAEVLYQSKEQDLMIRVAETYFNVLRALDQQQSAQAEEKAQATLLEQTRERFDVGLIPINDVHETQAAYDSAVANRISTDANVGIQLDALGILTGLRHEEIAVLAESFVVQPIEPNNSQAWVDLALDNSPELKSSRLTAEAADYGVRAAKGQFKPTVEGSLSYTDNRSDTDTVGRSSSIAESDTAQASISLRVPLYAGGRLSATYRQAQQRAVNADEKYSLAKRRLIQNVRSLYLSVSTNIAQIKARQQAIISNKSVLEASKAGYEAGTRNIVDVVNAQRNVFQAERDYLDTLYDYIINQLSLKEAAGTLIVTDLEFFEKFLVGTL